MKCKYYTYILRCTDDSLYTGITTDISRRMSEHFSQNRKCAKYTRTHKPKQLEAVWQSDSRVLASKLEYRIKTLSKSDKEKLIKSDSLSLMQEKIDPTSYIRISIN